MAIEIEKRFLVEKGSWKDYATSSQVIHQGYISTNFKEWVTRIRIIDGHEAYITLKSSDEGKINHEFEYEIPLKDAQEIWERLKFKLTKKRYFLTLEKEFWIVDCFTGKNFPLIIAEIELETINSVILNPDWCGKEITGDKKFTNASLAQLPISNWSTQEKKALKKN